MSAGLASGLAFGCVVGVYDCGCVLICGFTCLFGFDSASRC